MADLRVKFCGIDFKNPILVASAETSNSVANIKKCIDYGASGIIVKTIGDIPAFRQLTKNSKYCILNDKTRPIEGKVPRSFTFYSRSGYNSQPHEEWIPILQETVEYARQNDSHIIGNVTSGTLQGWADLAKMTEDCGVSMLEINLLYPAPPELTGRIKCAYIAQDPDMTAEITRVVTEAVNIPVMVKQAPEAIDLTDIARAAQGAGAAAVCVNSRFKGFATDIETGKPYIDGPAGVGGPWVKPLTLRWVQDIYSQLGMEISGSNGIYDGKDAIEFLMSGAKIMQVCSILMLKGIEWLPKMIKDVETFMDSHGYPDIDSLYGISARAAVTSFPELMKIPHLEATINRDTCLYPKCKICTSTCFYDVMRPGENQIDINIKNCIGCQLCMNTCPTGSITMVPQGTTTA